MLTLGMDGNDIHDNRSSTGTTRTTNGRGSKGNETGDTSRQMGERFHPLRSPVMEQGDADDYSGGQTNNSWWKRSLVHRLASRSRDDDENDEMNSQGAAYTSLERLESDLRRSERRRVPDVSNDGSEAQYTALDTTASSNANANNGEHPPANLHDSLPSVDTRKLGSKRVSTGLRQSLLNDANDNDDAVVIQEEKPAKQTTTVEDVLQQDCHFFYRDMDGDRSPPPARRKQSWRAVVRQQQEEQVHQHQQMFEYSDAVTVLAPPVLQRYRTRYQQLNQDLDYYDRESSAVAVSDDLELIETVDDYNSSGSNMLQQRDRIVRTDTVENSTLFYQLADGRLLMRLPRDQVRLVMDQDLEAGILSVEQWRCKEESTISSELPQESPPPLRYVLTVHDDLYKRIVSEMSETLTKPYCGLNSCCQEGEKVDIRVAAAALLVILFILLINTLIWK